MMNLTNPPDAPRLIHGLRDTGYDFNTAAADIVDNSISANASAISIEIVLTQEGRKFVYFGDDGDGMNLEELYDAMRYGAKARANLASLGKFGLGLKTASSSVCLRFTVLSKRKVSDELAKLTWDLDHVTDADSWDMLQEDVTADEFEAFEEFCGETGTLVIWSNCDRLLQKSYDEPGGAKEKAAIKRVSENLAAHLALVHHRFLDQTDARAANVSIFVNGEALLGWNPFFPEGSEQVLGPNQQNLECILEDGSVEVAVLKAWILPHSNDCSDEQKKVIRHSNKGQGFYVFRENRLIQTGGWLGIYGWGAMEPHMSLLRLELDFTHELDEAFMVDVKKSRILLDPALETRVKSLITPVRREADARNRRISKAGAAKKGVDHTSSNKSVEKNPNVKKPSVVSANANENTVIVSNTFGPKIKLKAPVQNDVKPESVHIEAVEDMHSGGLWEPALRSASDEDHTAAVRINKHHDFYQKIYSRASNSGYSVEGMDLLLWALATAELDHKNPELEAVFEDFREEVALNLKRLLRDVNLPTEHELDGTQVDIDD
ncbi:ATP-binding protein [Tateyamaria sp.]|uniref:ATP-binding protein n=1 Tax=Tateyamaria sp. TaxID=1929288 RepID=UPI00329B8358